MNKRHMRQNKISNILCNTTNNHANNMSRVTATPTYRSI